MESLLATSHLDAGYATRVVLADIDLELMPHTICCLIGPNGAGKSTLLKTLAGQLDPIRGRVYYGSRPLRALSQAELARERSVLLTERLRTERLTCRDVVEMGRYPYTGALGILSEADHVAVDEAMEATDTRDLADADLMQVSDGQRQRVLLARALCQRPHVLILDEPLSYLDIRYQIEACELLRSLVRTQELTVVCSLHELSLAAQLADWLVCVRDGRVTFQGTPESVFTQEVICPLFDIDPACLGPDGTTIRLRVRG